MLKTGPQNAEVASIPALPSSQMRMGQADEAIWDLQSPTSQRAVLPVGVLLNLRVLLRTSQAPAAPAVRLLSNLFAAQPFREFRTFALRPAADGAFVLEKLLEGAGRFYIYAQYTLDGQQWFWMRGPPLLLLVYPQQLCGLRMYISIPSALGPMHTWAAELTRIKDLGFNMLHLLPLTRQGHSQSPYAARDLFEFEPDLFDRDLVSTALETWESFVQEASDLGLGLCLDLVLNHVAVDSRIASECPDWIIPDQSESDGLKRAGYMAGDRWEKWDDLVLINYAHPHPETRQQIWSYFRAYSLYWAAYAARTKGMLRLDNLHSTYPPFASAITREIRQLFPNLGILGEFFGSHERLLLTVKQDEIDFLLGTLWEHHFTHELRRYLRYLHETSAFLPWFCPVNSHDSGTPAQEFAAVGSTAPRYLVSALLGTGATGMSQGVERGLLNKINFIGRNPQLQFAEGADFSSLIRQVNQWLATIPQFQQGASIRFVDHEHPAVLAALRYCAAATDSTSYLVVANLDIHNPQFITIDLLEALLKDRQLFDLFSGQDIAVSSPAFTLNLEPCGVRVIAAALRTT